ncbi:MAG: hypothetical protein HY369_00305 [Candidatus Aenigmarchaeota archaeon]|nr:hypothetical protein [Candidatus Aenigmarchaeota archaeon]
MPELPGLPHIREFSEKLLMVYFEDAVRELEGLYRHGTAAEVTDAVSAEWGRCLGRIALAEPRLSSLVYQPLAWEMQGKGILAEREREYADALVQEAQRRYKS